MNESYGKAVPRIITIPDNMCAESLSLFLGEVTDGCKVMPLPGIILQISGNISDPAIVLALKDFIHRTRLLGSCIILVTGDNLTRRIFSALNFFDDVIFCDNLQEAVGEQRDKPAEGMPLSVSKPEIGVGVHKTNDI